MEGNTIGSYMEPLDEYAKEVENYLKKGKIYTIY